MILYYILFYNKILFLLIKINYNHKNKKANKQGRKSIIFYLKFIHINLNCKNAAIKLDYSDMIEDKIFSSKQIELQCPPLYWITLGEVESYNINRLIQLANICFILNQKKVDTSLKLSRS